MVATNDSYQTTWDQYWGDITAQTGAALWDVAPDHAAARDLKTVQAHLANDRPLVDLGCGNATQTWFFGQHFDRVVGVDISQVVIDAVAEKSTMANVSFRQLDILDVDACRSLHADIGDAHVYIRGVIHQLNPDHWQQAIAGLQTLIGQTGTALIVELGGKAHRMMAQIQTPPPKLAEVLAHGIRPAALAPGDIQKLFGDNFEILAHGDTAMHTTQPLPDGNLLQIPAEYWAVRQRG